MNFTTLVDFDDKNKLIKTTAGELVNYTKMWSKNRPPDQNRILEIAEYINKTKIIDGIISLAGTGNFLHDEGLVCYDGNHRREACKLIDSNMKSSFSKNFPEFISLTS